MSHPCPGPLTGPPAWTNPVFSKGGGMCRDSILTSLPTVPGWAWLVVLAISVILVLAYALLHADINAMLANRLRSLQRR